MLTVWAVSIDSDRKGRAVCWFLSLLLSFPVCSLAASSQGSVLLENSTLKL